jgi:hypothetical protein
MRRAGVLVGGAVGLAAITAWWARGTAEAPAQRVAPAQRMALEEALTVPAAQGLREGPLGPVLLGEVRRRGLRDVLEVVRTQAAPVFDVSAFGEEDGGWGALDPAAPLGQPVLDGDAALLDPAPIPGPLLVQARPEDAVDRLTACVARGAWCLVVADRGAAVWAGDEATASAFVDRAGRALPTGVYGLWLSPEGPRTARLHEVGG